MNILAFLLLDGLVLTWQQTEEKVASDANDGAAVSEAFAHICVYLYPRFLFSTHIFHYFLHSSLHLFVFL